MLTLLTDPTFQFSVGAILGLGAVAVGYGILRNTVANLKTDFTNHEQENRTDVKELGDRIRYLERKEDMRKGAERARDNRHPSDTTITKEFTNRDER